MTNENANDFWERTKSLIKQRGTTQDWVAKQSDVTINVLKSWIFNKRLPDAAQATRIAKALNTTVEYLVTGEESDERRQLAELKAKVLDFAKSVQ